MNIEELNKKLKLRLIEYLTAKKGYVVSIHINTIEIATCLIQFAIEEKRQISLDERQWFNGAYHISYILDGSEWQDLSDMYCQVCDYIEQKNYIL